MYEVIEAYNGSGKDGYLTLEKGWEVEVLDKSGSDWLVCTVAEACNGIEKEGIVPNCILKPVTRPGKDIFALLAYLSHVMLLCTEELKFWRRNKNYILVKFFATDHLNEINLQNSSAKHFQYGLKVGILTLSHTSRY